MDQQPHSLKEQLAGVRVRARVALVTYGVGCVLAVMLAAGLALGLLDAASRIDDRLVRLLCCGLWWIGVAAAVYVFLYPALAVRLSDVHLALRVQQLWPELGDRLSSAVEFIDQSEDDVLAGSPDLRRTVIADAAARVERCALPEVVDFRRPLISVLVGAGLAGVVILLFCVAPTSASLAARRLFLPFTTDSWPRRHELAFDNPPDQLASGDEFKVSLKDENGELPKSVEILFRPLGEEESVADRQPMEYDPDSNRMTYQLRNVTQSFEYRAVGGDFDVEEWNRLEVIQPPRIESLQITLRAPAYTGWPVEKSDRHIRALAGTLAEVRGAATKPLLAAALEVETPQGRSQLPAQLAENAKTFKIPADGGDPWLIEESGVYGFQLTDEHQFEQKGQSRWELRAIEDRPPTISLERPGTNTYVTPNAELQLKALIKDDLLIRSVDLTFRRSSDDSASPDDDEQINLYQGPPQAPPSQRSPLSAGGLPGDSLSIDRPWDLSQLEGLEPGDSIEFFLTATDYKPQENQCTLRRLTVISADELAERIAQRQTFILGQLAEAITAQRDSRAQTKALSIQLEEVGSLDAQGVNHLQSAELNQRRVEQLLVDERDGLGLQIEELLADLASNRVDSPDTQRRMEGLLAEIRRVAADHLTVVQQQLVLGIKTAQARRPGQATPPSQEIKKRLEVAGQHQDQVIDTLERLRSQLAKWDSYRRFAREIRQLSHRQQDLAGDTVACQLDVLGRDLQQLSSTEKARLRQLAERQFELARELERILGRMEQMQSQLADVDPLAAETIGDAVDIARRRAIAETMRAGGRDMEVNRLGQSIQSHESIDAALEEMLDLLAGRRAHELSRLLDKLQEQAAELDDTIEQTKGLIRKMRQAEEEAGRLSPQERQRQLERLVAEQKRLIERAERVARQLKRLQAEQPGQTMGQAAQNLGKACAAQQKGQDKAALEHADNAQQDLERAADQLRRQVQQFEQDLLQEQFAKLEQQVEMFRDRQQTVLDETQRLRELQVKQGRLTRGQAESVRDLAREQRGLADEAGTFAESFTEAPVFHEALRGAAGDMNRSAARLVRRLLADTTQRIQQEAVERLDDLLTVLKPDEPAENGNGQNGQAQGDSPNAGGVTSLVELKLLKIMQEDVYRRTVEIQEARQRRGGALTEELIAQFKDLAEEQGRLAQLLLDLTEPPDEPPEENPENLPDLRDEGLLEPDLDALLEEEPDDAFQGNEDSKRE